MKTVLIIFLAAAALAITVFAVMNRRGFSALILNAIGGAAALFAVNNIADEIAACTNVYNQYFKALFSDAVDDYDAMVKTLQDEMKAAGIEKIVAEKQAQLDAFLAAK